MTFEDVVKQLQMNNRSEAGRDGRHTKMLGDLKTAIEGLTVATESTDEPDAAEEETKKDERSRAKKLLDAVGGLKDSIGTAFSKVGAIKTGVPGLTLGLLAKLAVIPLLIKFLQSDVWDRIKAFLLDPSFKELGNLFDEYTVSLTALTAIVGGYAITKIITTATALGSAFGAIGTGLASVGAVVGLSATAVAGTIVAIVIGIVAVAKGLFDAIKVFKEKFAETGSVFESLKASASEFLASAIANIALVLDGLKFVVSKLANAFGFEKVSEFLDSFSLVDLFRTYFTQPLTDFVVSIFSFFEKAFVNDVERILKLFDFMKTIPEKLSGAFDTVKTFLTEIPDRIRDLMPDVGAIFEDAKQKVLGAVDRVKASIPTPDFSVIGQKITDLANFFSPTRILTSIGDSINERFQPDGFVGRLTKKAIMKIFPTSPVEVDEPTIGGGITPMQSGGFLGANSFALVGEQGPELIMSKAPMQVFSEQRTDQIGMAALNKLMGGGVGGGGSGTMFLNTGSNVQNVSKSTIVTPIVDQDPVIREVGRSLAM